jgi:hypothetical protein
MNISVHIERLVLDGLSLDARQASTIEAGIVRELHALLKAGGLAPDLVRGGALAALPDGSVRLAGNDAPGRTGGRIAGAIYAGLGGRR